jgi:hypothetical protein
MARVTSMAMRTQYILDDERAAWEESDRQLRLRASSPVPLDGEISTREVLD